MRTPQQYEQLSQDLQTRFDLRELLESVWYNSNEATRITDSEGVIVEANDAYCRFTGMQHKELIGKLFTIVYDQSIDPSHLV
jgi:PAS domain S-box-containing protein